MYIRCGEYSLLKFGVRTISFMPYPYEILCVLSGKHALPATRFLDFLPPMTSRFGAKLLSTYVLLNDCIPRGPICNSLTKKISGRVAVGAAFMIANEQIANAHRQFGPRAKKSAVGQ